MRRSSYFIPTIKDTPADAQIASHRLMLRAGMVRQAAAGIYNWLPLGIRVLQKVENIVREEMNAAGALHMHMPILNSKELWDETGRWDKYEEGLMFKLTDRHDRAFCLGPTHEETITAIYRDNVQSYRDLPLNLYQIQTKFRDEFRPRFGLMRSREFLMKDAYSFDVSKEKALESYQNMYDAYVRIFTHIGFDFRPVVAATGDIGGDYSHEFHVLAAAGEDDLLFDPDSDYAVNVEKYDASTAPRPKEELQKARGIEAGHCFYLGTTYTEPMGAMVTQPDGTQSPVHMGCYGIGVSRCVAAAIEQHNDDDGIIWPAAIAPFQVHLINVRANDASCTKAADEFYTKLQEQGVEVLYDDRDDSAGKKFAEADLIGCPWQCAIGPKGVARGIAEWKNRRTGEKLELPLGQVAEGV